MKIDNKFAEQLTLALDDPKSASQEAIAQLLFMSAGQLSRIKNATRATDKSIRVGLAHVLHDVFLAFSGARNDYGLLSFLKDTTKHDDVITSLFRQKKEENDRRALEESFDEAMTTKKELRSPQQILLINDYFREYAEEIMAEHTDIAKKAEYAGINVQDVFDKANANYGG
ncbi:transcriptional regulator [Levilactobacillus andaensis]|uniref:transcriptional regulator n=1 Tax=Levilactobacillus andaensis TaxID=2799570 RepID=UPI001F17A4F3|nr:transcriptional regulator [Levilactobacillus andaensis]